MEMRNLEVFLDDNGIDSVRLNTPGINSFVFDCGSITQIYT